MIGPGQPMQTVEHRAGDCILMLTSQGLCAQSERQVTSQTVNCAKLMKRMFLPLLGEIDAFSGFDKGGSGGKFLLRNSPHRPV
jgi:hypothetical protein